MFNRKYSLRGILSVALLACVVGIMFGVSNLIKETSFKHKISNRTLERQFDMWQNAALPDKVAERRVSSCVPIDNVGMFTNPECPVSRMKIDACSSLILWANEPLERRKWQIIKEEALLRSCDSLLALGGASRLDTLARYLHLEKIDILSRMNNGEDVEIIVSELSSALKIQRQKFEVMSRGNGFRVDFSVRLYPADSVCHTISFVKGVDDDFLTFVHFE